MKVSEIIGKCAKKYQINPGLIAAIIHCESSGNPWAIRYEPDFYRRYVKLKTKDTLLGYVPRLCTLSSEKMYRSTSFGLMQVMGQVAREFGFKGEFLTELCNPEVGIYYGVEVLKHRCLAKENDLNKALLRYNGGGDPTYGEKVLGVLTRGEAQYLLIS